MSSSSAENTEGKNHCRYTSLNCVELRKFYRRHQVSAVILFI